MFLLRRRIRTIWEPPGSSGLTLSSLYSSFMTRTDIIGCLVAGVIFTAFFFYWNAYLPGARAHPERGSSTAWWQPPPLIPGDLWLRANGRFLAILMIVFWTWSSFLSNNFCVRSPPFSPAILHSDGTSMRWIELWTSRFR